MSKKSIRVYPIKEATRSRGKRVGPRRLIVRSGMNLSRSWLSHITISGQSLCATNFSYSRLDRVTFIDCDLQRSIFYKTELNNVQFIRTKLLHVEHLHMLNLSRTNLIYFSSKEFGSIYGYEDTDGELRIRAGCRNMMASGLLWHWKHAGNRSIASDGVRWMSGVARARGWKVST